MLKEISEVRLDKWLWAARFFKTRSLATEAIKGGKVHVNGQRTKPSKLAQKAQILNIRKSANEWQVEIIALADKRQSAPLAQMLYEETTESIARREKEATLRRLANHATPTRTDRPTKKDRRQIIKFTSDSE